MDVEAPWRTAWKRTAKTCGPDAPWLASTVATVHGSPGRARYRAVKPLRRGCRMFSAALYAHARTLLPIAHETSGAARIRHSLRPLDFGGGKDFFQTRAQSVARIQVLIRHPRATAKPLSLEALAGFGEPRRMNRPQTGRRPSRLAEEARTSG